MKKNLPIIILIGFSLAVAGILVYRAVIAQGGSPQEGPPVDWTLKLQKGKVGIIEHEDGTPIATFQSDGKIGIGKRNPTAVLDIKGVLNFAGGISPFCIFAQSCPAGWTDSGPAGFISPGKCPYEQGGPVAGVWKWCHPRLCCNITVDRDGDGWRDEQDCAPDDKNIYPGAPPRWNSGIDTNCSGIAEYSVDAGSVYPYPIWASNFCNRGGKLVWKIAGAWYTGCHQSYCGSTRQAYIMNYWANSRGHAVEGSRIPDIGWASSDLCYGKSSGDCGSSWMIYCD